MPTVSGLLADALRDGDLARARTLLSTIDEVRAQLDDCIFAFDAPAVVAFAHDLPTIELLLEFGANPNARSRWWAGGFHPLHVAEGAVAERLIEAGAEIDCCAAAHLDRLDLLRDMVARSADCVHERGGDGKTPLHFARSRAAADVLLGAGADIDARDIDHRATPAEWMLDRTRDAGRYSLAEYLVERGARTDIFLAAALGRSAHVESLLIDDPSLLDRRTGEGEYGARPPSSFHIYFWTIGQQRSPLDVTAQFGHPDTLAVMEQFATPMQRFVRASRSGDRAQAMSIVQSHGTITSLMTVRDHRVLADAAWHGDVDAVELMLELGFDPAVAGHDGGTALHCAAWQGSIGAVQALLDHPAGRALVHVRDAHYHGTPLDWCGHGSVNGHRSRDHAAVAELLLRAGAVADLANMHASPAVRRVIEHFSA